MQACLAADSDTYNAFDLSASIATTDSILSTSVVGYVSSYNHSDYFGNYSTAYCFEVPFTVSKAGYYRVELVISEGSNSSHICNGTIEVDFRATDRTGMNVWRVHTIILSHFEVCGITSTIQSAIILFYTTLHLRMSVAD